MAITGRQIRAARALLDMSQEELAQHAGLTPQGIRKIEDGTSQPREGTLADLMQVFTERRLEFLDGQGVRFRDEGVEVLNGKNGLGRFFDLVFSHTQTSGGTIRQNGIEESLFDKCAPEYTEAHRNRMEILVHSRKDIFVRAILQDGDSNFVCTDYADYRWYPQNVPPPVPYYIFGDSIGIFAFDADPAPKIILITSPVISLAFSTQFDRTWDAAKVPPQAKPAKRR
jgi:transcriptional regulator with XRE-family HTH domain